METPSFSYYDVLGVSPSASQEEIKAAYSAAVSHPDVTSGPNAAQLMASLNDAYAVLSNPDKRRDYDAAITAGVSTSEPTEQPNELWQFYACDRCGKVDAYLRLAIFYRVWSIVIYSQMKGDGGILCPNCRSNLAASTALSSAFLGPWGLPWGLVYTLRALFASVRGGKMPRQENADLLRHQGTAFLQRGSISEAKAAFTDSLKFEKLDSVVTLLNDPLFHQAEASPGPGWLKGQTLAALLWLVPPVIVIVLFAWIASGGSTSSGSSGAYSSVTPNPIPSGAYTVTTTAQDGEVHADNDCQDAIDKWNDSETLAHFRSHAAQTASACDTAYQDGVTDAAADSGAAHFLDEHNAAVDEGMASFAFRVEGNTARSSQAFDKALALAQDVVANSHVPRLVAGTRQFISELTTEPSARPSTLPDTTYDAAMQAGAACQKDVNHYTPDAKEIADCTHAIVATERIERATQEGPSHSQADVDSISLMIAAELYGRGASELHSGDPAGSADVAESRTRAARILANKALAPQDLEVARMLIHAIDSSR